MTIKLVVKSEAKLKEAEAETKLFIKLQRAVLAQLPDHSHFLENNLTLQRFLDARNTFEESVLMLVTTLNRRNEGNTSSDVRLAQGRRGRKLFA